MWCLDLEFGEALVDIGIKIRSSHEDLTTLFGSIDKKRHFMLPLSKQTSDCCEKGSSVMGKHHVLAGRSNLLAFVSYYRD